MSKFDFHFEDILLDKEAQEDLAELPLARAVFRGFRVLSFVLIALVGGQMVRIGIFQGDEYALRASANSENYRILPASRGLILDRFGKTLADTTSAFQAILIPGELPRDTKERDAALSQIASFFGRDQKELLEETLRKLPFFDSRIVLQEHLTEDELIQASSLTFPGLRVEEGLRRFYENPIVFSHVLGYTSPLDKEDLEKDPSLFSLYELGRSGLEAYYDSSLRGTNGLLTLLRDSRGEVKESRTARESLPGQTIRTTIDKEFQEYFYGRMEEGLRGLGRSVGVGIAMNPQNGEVLALFAVPGFDVSRLTPYLTDARRPLFNRAVSGLYSPGSTIKPLHALAALTEGVVKPETSIFSSGALEVPNPFNPSRPSIFKDWRAHGWVNARSALARSSNVYFYQIGGGFGTQPGLGIKRLKEWWERFRLHLRTGIDISGEAAGFLPDPKWKEEASGRAWLRGDTYNVSIGQGDFLITPLGLLSYISTIANGGTIYRPYLMTAMLGENGKVVRARGAEVSADFRSEFARFLPIVQDGMADVVSSPYGTAYQLNDLPLRTAGKTGSAQVEGNTKTNAFFVGYGPIGNDQDTRNKTQEGEAASVPLERDSGEPKPEIAILVLIEDAREGSLNAVPIAKDVFLWYYENRIQARNNAEGDADTRGN
ncbi:MAG: penicillin-binding transpeptidase domain-containing protein [Nanoarchaeota archaeon]|nr:penicillin-binding transpeptidase domain-containing protein [Nanoarchaeota archaeon]